jgi:23S rRNA-/tRNA-specific pseudouridylate synthase
VCELIPIVWDGDIAVAVCKPAGLPTQAPRGIDSLESRLRLQLRARSSYVAFPHRLDRPVSGVVLVALTKRAARLLSDQFASRKVHKVYIAEVDGEVNAARTIWKDWLRKMDDMAQGEVCHADSAGAKNAETVVERLRYMPERNASLLKLSPTTGRMHQLRLQTSHRGHPIIGDSLYAPTKEAAAAPCERICLHSQSITFHDPRNSLIVCAAVDHAFGSELAR